MPPTTGPTLSVDELAHTSRGTVRLTNVSKAYRLGPQRVEALRSIDMTIVDPGFYAIMGPSGSGKSTLLHLLGGLDRPDRGEITVGQHRLDQMSESHLTRFRRHDVGIVFQQFNLIPTFTALENVMLPGMLDGSADRSLRARAESLLDRLGLLNRAAHRPDALSGGEQQRAAIARAMFFEPALLLADEPTGNLDSRSAEQMWRLLKELASEREMTVLMVTHESAAAAHCCHVFHLRDGRFVNDTEMELRAESEAKPAIGAEQPEW